MPSSKRRAPHRRDKIYQATRDEGRSAWPTVGGGGGDDPLRYVEIFGEDLLKQTNHEFPVPPGSTILFDEAGRELEVGFLPNLSGWNSFIEFNGSLAVARVIHEAVPLERLEETFTATSSHALTHDLGRTPSSVNVVDSVGREVDVAWKDVTADQIRLDFNGTLTDATALVEGQPSFRHEETFSATSTFRVEHGFGVTPGSVLLFDSSGYEVMVAWQDDGVGEVIDINFNGTLTNARVLVSAVEEDMTASDYYMEVARGNVAGQTAFHMAGTNTDVDLASGEIIWNVGGAYNDLSAAQTIDVVSDSASDTIAGSGAQKVTVYGLDAAYALQEEEVDTSGVTPVTTTATFTMVHALRTTQVGGSQRNVGTITAEGSTDTNTICQIGSVTAGDGESAACLFMVPAATTLYMNQIQASVAKWSPATAQVSVALFVQEFGGSVLRKTPIGTCIVGSTGFPMQLAPPIAIPAKALVYLFAETSIDDTYVHGEFSGVLIAD